MCAPCYEWDARMFAPLAVKPVAPPPAKTIRRSAPNTEQNVSWRWAWYGRP